MLTPEQLDLMASAGLRAQPEMTTGEAQAASEALAVATDMRTPITAEALVQAGWGHDECWFDLPSSIVAVQQRDRAVFDVYVIDGDTSVHAKGAENMHDLAELVRLLGGAK